ncbi:MAG: hypothetical protein ACJ788_13380 [Ktedonobacteraceae bacterium]
MSKGSYRLTQEEMGRRFDELLAIPHGAKTDTFKSVAQKWAERERTGKPLTVGMMRLYYSKITRLHKRGVNLHEKAKVYTWSQIIWPPKSIVF